MQPSYDRTRGKDTNEVRLKKLSAHLEAFRKKMDEAYPNVLPRNELAAWALGQHYDLNTPLLDWTASPYMAAYFAFVKRSDQDEQGDDYRYVYALDRSIERYVSKLKLGKDVLSRDQAVVFIDQLPFPNPRFLAQQGLFTNQLHGKAIEEFVKSFAKKNPDELLLVKFKIPAQVRDECLRDLKLMNINHISLLLDLRTVVDNCNKLL